MGGGRRLGTSHCHLLVDANSWPVSDFVPRLLLSPQIPPGPPTSHCFPSQRQGTDSLHFRVKGEGLGFLFLFKRC